MNQKRPVLRAAALCAPAGRSRGALWWARTLWPLAPYPARRSTTGTIRRSLSGRTVVQGCELLVYRIGGPLDVSGGEQVQECVAQDGEHDSAQRLTGRVSRSVTVSVAPSTASQSSTVARAEPFHGPSGFDQGARIALNPQGQQGRCSAAAS